MNIKRDEIFKKFPFVDIPDIIAEYIGMYHGINLQFNINQVDVVNGYGAAVYPSVKILKYKVACNNCDYDSLWHPDDSESKCGHHTYGTKRYDTIFYWTPLGTDLTLEEAFEIWLKAQPEENEWDKPVKYMSFGNF